MIVDSTSKKHHTAITIDSGDPVMLFRSRAGHYDEVLWDTITTTHPALAEVPVGGSWAVICHNSSSQWLILLLKSITQSPVSRVVTL
jgi:hypothetical protein